MWTSSQDLKPWGEECALMFQCPCGSVGDAFWQWGLPVTFVCLSLESPAAVAVSSWKSACSRKTLSSFLSQCSLGVWEELPDGVLLLHVLSGVQNRIQGRVLPSARTQPLQSGLFVKAALIILFDWDFRTFEVAFSSTNVVSWSFVGILDNCTHQAPSYKRLWLTLVTPGYLSYICGFYHPIMILNWQSPLVSILHSVDCSER